MNHIDKMYQELNLAMDTSIVCLRTKILIICTTVGICDASSNTLATFEAQFMKKLNGAKLQNNPN